MTWRPWVVLLLTVLVAGCTGAASNQPAQSSPSVSSTPVVYAAIGASETVGVGSTNPTHDAWPQVFYRTALPRSAVFYNFGIPGATVESALSDELPEALSVHPTLVTVWLNVNDLIAGVSASSYEGQLDQLVTGLKQGGVAKILVANTPYLDRLPAFVECRAGAPSGGVTCPPEALPPPDVVNADVSAYNASTADVAQRDGAILVDLHSQGEVPSIHPDWVSGDGFHPSTAGYVAVAGAFASALRAASAQP